VGGVFFSGFDDVARPHRVAIRVEPHTGKQARLASAGARVALSGVACELRLNRIPQRLIDNRRVLAGIGLCFVNDLAEVNAVLQYQVERTAREWLAPRRRPEAHAEEHR
jgi:hypothetical protein